jgi:hypothetical protein
MFMMSKIDTDLLSARAALPIAGPMSDSGMAFDVASSSARPMADPAALPGRRISLIAWSVAGIAGIALWVVILRLI